MLSCSVFLYFSPPHLALSSSAPTSFVLCSSLSLSFSAARSSAPFPLDNAVRSPLSLCDGGMTCGVRGRWSDGGVQHRETHTLPSHYRCLLLPLNIFQIIYLLSVCQLFRASRLTYCIKGSIPPNYWIKPWRKFCFHLSRFGDISLWDFYLYVGEWNFTCGGHNTENSYQKQCEQLS